MMISKILKLSNNRNATANDSIRTPGEIGFTSRRSRPHVIECLYICGFLGTSNRICDFHQRKASRLQ